MRADESGSGGRLGAVLDGRYVLHQELGAGATATVYLATDLRYSRPVAIKVLHPRLAEGLGAERFFREIRVSGRLTHARIVQLLDSGEAEGLFYFVMSYVPGESLRQRLRREGRLPIEDAVSIASHVAAALEYAHGRGVLHRDIKPENVLLQDGEAFVADVGLALAVATAADERLSGSSVAVGTPRYMSPEQASGQQALDARSDVYALACVVYEMLTGEPPHTGHTLQAVVARVLTEPPTPLRTLRDTVPEGLGAAVMKALAKAPADRFRTAAEFAAALAAGAAGWSASNDAGAPTQGARADVRRWWAAPAARHIAAGVMLLGVVATALVAGREFLARRGAPELLTFTVPPPAGGEFALDLRDVSAISPDGREIVFAGLDSAGYRALWIRTLSEKTVRPIPGTEQGFNAFWSPDGKSIGFFRNRALFVIDSIGGPPRRIASTVVDARGGSWGGGGIIVFAPDPQSGLSMVWPATGAVRQLTTPDRRRREFGHMWPQLLPDNRRFLYYVASDIDSVRGIYVASMDSPRGRRVVGSSASAIYADGHLLYVRNGALVAQPFDTRTLALVGTPRLVADSVAVSYQYYGVFSASRNGRLVYANGSSRDMWRLQWFDSSGTLREGAYADAAYTRNPYLSRDGLHLVFETYRETDSDLRIMNLRTGTATLLVDSATQALVPVLSPEGRDLAYVVERPGQWGVYRQATYRADPPALLWSSPRYTVITDWSPDGRHLLLTQRTPLGDYDLTILTIGSGREPIALAAGRAHQGSGRFSRDGKRIAYVSLESGEPQIYVEAFPSTGARCQVSSRPGWQPVWGRSPTRLYYLTVTGTLTGVDLGPDAGSLCASGPPRPLFQSPVRNPAAGRSRYDVSLRDERFLFSTHAPDPNAAWLTVVVDWLALVKSEP
jgi:eukaryotic-like serine/threonine-protein kinase